MKTVLFLCTGNYYRSRFAEEYFNHRAAAQGLMWTATSRAVAIERGASNIGAVSPLALAALEAHGVVPRGHARPPAACTPADLDAADVIVALSEREHRGLMRERYAAWEARTAFWQAEDIGFASPAAALGHIAREIDVMIAALGNARGRHGGSS
jgi:protein-tyrosine phosphatase